MKTLSCVLLLLALQIPGLRASQAGEAQSPAFQEEQKRQEQILRSKGEQRPDGYVIDRNLESYQDTLSADFAQTLASLGPKDRWLDIGAGRAQAILDYYSPEYDLKKKLGLDKGGKAQAVAMSVEDRRTPQWHDLSKRLGGNQIRYVHDKLAREYSVADLGRFKVITDLLGGFSYTDEMSVFMEKVLGFLELNGTYYTVLQDVNSEAGTNKPFYANAPYLTELKQPDGSDVKVCSWLKSISCVQVSCELKAGWKPPIEVYRIQKVCNKVEVPPLQKLHFAAGTPPERRYRLIDRSVATPKPAAPSAK